MEVASRMLHLGTDGAFEMLAQAQALESQGKEIIHLEIGDPDFPTPRHIVEAGMQALRDGMTHYSATAGMPELREAIALNSREIRGGDTEPGNVVVTPGTKPLVLYLLLALAGPGVEIIYPDPGNPVYESLIRFAGASPVPVQLLEKNGYHPDLDALAGSITDKTRVMILNSPGDPCGSVLTKQESEAIASLVLKHPELYVLSDETYKDTLYAGEHHSISSIPGMRERTIVLDGFSKNYAMAGWRLGYGILPEELVAPVVKLANNHISCTATFTQHAGVAALEGPQDCLHEMTAEFANRRRLIVDGLKSIPGVDCPEPEGAFYVFPSVKNTGMTSTEFQNRALNEAGVALLSGAGFGDLGEGYVRLSYANSQENIIRAIDQLDRFVRSST
ncbi:MAG: pyridoxal phosphate-dependent aminotransferase [Chloroflexi bacterium]|nr:pyridoxal phosphate-dependent aminotransferase [Chloroflexota bacterium]MDA1271595.1 pyridoxal phosphate-dependent aminotransferase [Chloroflexota bacterium]PKB58365.1 MAG: aspartate aminotransferase [SAR202 cluster bacterium Casp-Chloro-G2]